MLTFLPERVRDRQLDRALLAELGANARLDNEAARTPADWSYAEGFGPYPNRRTRRQRPPRHAATGTVTERANRSDTARHARARRIKLARKGLAA